MADLDRNRLYDGTVATAGVVDVRRSSMRETAHYINVGTGTVEEVIAQAYDDFPITRSIAGVTVVLADISARMKSCSTAVAVARYKANVPNSSPGFDNIEWELASEQIQWVQTTATEPEDAEGFDPARPNDFYFGVAINEKNRNANGQFGPDGEPDGVPLTIGTDPTPVPYALKIPVWNIRVRTVLNFHPGPQIKPYITRPVNGAAVTWSGFLFPEKTLRFNGARVKQIGDDYHVMYSFTHRGGPWVNQMLIGVTVPKVDGDGEPVRDGNDNATFASKNGYVTIPMYKAAESFQTPGFPEAPGAG